MQRKDIIESLEHRFQTCFSKERNLLDYQNLDQNDARVTFYKHLINTLDATIHLLIFTDKHLLTTQWWAQTIKEYKIKMRSFEKTEIQVIEKESDYIDQHLLFSYFLFIFHTFESSFRIISKHCYPKDYLTPQGDPLPFMRLCNNILPKVGLYTKTEYKNFIRIVTKYRNSIHNNGVYISQELNPKILWKGQIYTFSNGNQIYYTDLWKVFIAFTDEYIDLFDKITKSINISKGSTITDITEI